MSLPSVSCNRNERNDEAAPAQPVTAASGRAAPVVHPPTIDPLPSLSGQPEVLHWGNAIPSRAGRTWLTAQLARNADEPLAFLHNEIAAQQPNLDLGAMMAAARIGTPPTIAALDGLIAGNWGNYAALGLALADEDDVGQDVLDHLWTRYAVAPIGRDSESFLFAFARLGQRTTLARLAAELANEAPAAATTLNVHAASLRASLLQAVAVMCTRRVEGAGDWGQRLAQMVQHPEPAIRAAALYAFSRCANSVRRDAPQEVSTWAMNVATRLSERSLEVQRLAWRALAALAVIPDNVDITVVGRALVGEHKDEGAAIWMVAIEAVRALAQEPSHRAALAKLALQPSLEWVVGARVHVALTLVRELGAHAQLKHEPAVVAGLQAIGHFVDETLAALKPERQDLQKPLLELASESAIALAPLDFAAAQRQLDRYFGHGATAFLPRRQAVLRCAALDLALSRTEAVQHKRITRWLFEHVKHDKNPQRAVYLAKIAGLRDASIWPLIDQALRTSDDPGELAALAEALSTREDGQSPPFRSLAPAIYSALARAQGEAWLEARLALLAVVREMLAHTAASAKIHDQEALKLMGQASTLLAEVASDPRVAVRRAVQDLREKVPALAENAGELRCVNCEPPAFMLPAAVMQELARPLEQASTGLRVITSRGSFVIDFRGIDAPINQANLVALARGGYFNGLTWHRVVPGFVTQGGDPKGDGAGGPGYTVPCERSSLRYVRGTVGMALSGKDTGGSQFFVAHSSQPHLDGRYTVIGMVRDGMEVVDALLVDDRIDKIEVMEP